MKKLEEYRGTQGDFHTHAHDLPPQMGGCFTNSNANQQLFSKEIDVGAGLGQLELVDFEVAQKSKQQFEALALERVIKHKESIIDVNPMKNKSFDQPLRAALTSMISKKIAFQRRIVPRHYATSEIEFQSHEICLYYPEDC